MTSRHSALRVVELVETATGERFSVRKARTPAQSYGRRFTVLFDETVAALAADLGGHGARVLLALPVRLDFRSWRPLAQVEVAEALRIDQSTVSRALAELVRLGAIERQGSGPATRWRLCRTIGYRGTAAQFHQQARDNVPPAAPPPPPPQASLRLGPSRVVQGGKRSPARVQARAH